MKDLTDEQRFAMLPRVKFFCGRDVHRLCWHIGVMWDKAPVFQEGWLAYRREWALCWLLWVRRS